MRRILAILTYIRGVELILIYMLLTSFMFIMYARLIIALQILEFSIILTSVLVLKIAEEKGKILLLMSALTCFVIDIVLLVVLLLSGLRILTIYVAFTSNFLIDIILTLLSIEIVRKY